MTDPKAESIIARHKDRGLVYCAGPYTKPDPVTNTRRAVAAGDKLVAAGWSVIIPHLTLFAHYLLPHEPEFWYAYDLGQLKRCTHMLRLPGESWGAEVVETMAAEQYGIPVFVGEPEEFIAEYEWVMAS
jgi:hypothetical protein